MKKQLAIFSIFLIALGCKKPHTSYWQVNDGSFSTDKVTFSYSPGASVLSNNSYENGFSIFLMPGGELPRSGYISINMPYPGSGGAKVTFYYKSKAYTVPTNPGSTAIQFSASGKKAILTIEPTWLKTWDSTATDSILVQGKLSEP